MGRGSEEVWTMERIERMWRQEGWGQRKDARMERMQWQEDWEAEVEWKGKMQRPFGKEEEEGWKLFRGGRVGRQRKDEWMERMQRQDDWEAEERRKGMERRHADAVWKGGRGRIERVQKQEG